MRVARYQRLRNGIIGSAVLGALFGVACAVVSGPGEYLDGDDPPDAGLPDADLSDSGGDADLPSGTVARLFVLGGDRDGVDDYDTPANALWFADVQEDGSVGEWKTGAAPLYSGYFDTTILGGKLFALGRSPHVESLNKFLIEAAPPTEDGVGPWIGALSEQSHSRDRMSVVLHDGYAYALGGSYTYTDDAGDNQTGYADDVIVSRLDPDALAVLPFTDTSDFGQGRRDAALLVLEGHLFVIGGYAWGVRAEVDIAPIQDADGTLGEFVEVGSLGETTADGGLEAFGVQRAAVCSHGDDIYVIGGDSETGPSDAVWTTTFDASAMEIDDWRQTTEMPGGLDAPACVVLGDTLYVIGGRGPSSRSVEVLRTTIQDGGDLDTWEVEAAELPFGRSRHAVVALVADP